MVLEHEPSEEVANATEVLLRYIREHPHNISYTEDPDAILVVARGDAMRLLRGFVRAMSGEDPRG
jgi:hypothetical protein